MSVSLGVPGATLNFGGRAGTSLTVGIPGSGLSYRHHFVTTPDDAPEASEQQPTPIPMAPERHPATLPGEIKSAVVSTLTTPDLEGLKRLLNEAAVQRRQFEQAVADALEARNRAWRSLERARKFPLKVFLANRVPRLEASFQQAQAELVDSAAKLDGCHVEVDFAFDQQTMNSYETLVRAHVDVRRCERVWDVTSSVFVDRVKTRSAASNSVTRQPVTLSDAGSGIVASRWAGIQFENANGADIEIYPGFCLMRETTEQDYALIDVRDVDIGFREQRFIEEEQLPKDAEVVGYAWEKSNKDGSRDLRFNNNRQLPVMGYGQLEFHTSQGLNEAYLISNSVAAKRFALAFADLQHSLRILANSPQASDSVSSSPALVESASTYQIPDPPKTHGAHEYSLGALALAGGVAWWGFASPTQISTPNAPVRPAEISASVQPPSTRPEAKSSQTPARTVEATTSTPLAESAKTLQRANLRAGPSTGAAILKTIEAGVVLKVYGRTSGWVQVGIDQPTGWINATLLGPTQ